MTENTTDRYLRLELCKTWKACTWGWISSVSGERVKQRFKKKKYFVEAEVDEHDPDGGVRDGVDVVN